MFHRDRVDDLAEAISLAMNKKEQEDSEGRKVLWIFAVIGAIAVMAAVAVAVYRYFTPDYLDEFDEDFDDDFDDDYFDEYEEDAEDVEPAIVVEAEPEEKDPEVDLAKVVDAAEDAPEDDEE